MKPNTKRTGAPTNATVVPAGRPRLGGASHSGTRGAAAQCLPCLQVLPTFFDVGTPGALAAAVAALCDTADAAVRDGAGCLILSDRCPDMAPARVPVPMLVAVGAVHHHLIRAGLRSDTSIVTETAACFSTHHVAVLVGYGCHAVCPYLALETCRQWRTSKRTQSLIKTGRLPDISMRRVQANYKKALEKGVLKILSKMGISLLACYHGAQIFEVYGLGADVIDVAFRGTVSRIGGLSLNDVQVRLGSITLHPSCHSHG
jgi:glutamate synthase (ferredoxin)